MTLTAHPRFPAAGRMVLETRAGGAFPIWSHDEWSRAFPWLVQGITGRAGTEPHDMSLFGATPTGVIQSRWAEVQRLAGFASAVHGKQVHGAFVSSHTHAVAGLLITGPGDGHVTDRSGVLLTVSVADCVPISIIDARRRAVALLHGGWRGIAAGILENGIAALRERVGSSDADIHVHFGPAICGACYKVGPEVHEALGTGSRVAEVDLRALLAARAAAIGLQAARITSSAHCTCCATGFHSHRAGARERQIAFLGVRPDTFA